MGLTRLERQSTTFAIYFAFDVPLDIVSPASLATFFHKNRDNYALIDAYCEWRGMKSLKK